MWLADHGTSGPEVVLAVGVAPSRRWAEQWYGLVVAVAPCSVAGCGHLQRVGCSRHLQRVVDQTVSSCPGSSCHICKKERTTQNVNLGPAY